MSYHYPLLRISSLLHGFCCPLSVEESQFHTDGSLSLACIIVVNCHLMYIHHFWPDTSNSALVIKVIFQKWNLSMILKSLNEFSLILDKNLNSLSSLWKSHHLNTLNQFLPKHIVWIMLILSAPWIMNTS